MVNIQIGIHLCFKVILIKRREIYYKEFFQFSNCSSVRDISG